jgi:hypothetical protein
VIIAITSGLSKLTTMARLVNALTELGIIPKKGKPSDSFAEQDRLLNVRNQMARLQGLDVGFGGRPGEYK